MELQRFYTNVNLSKLTCFLVKNTKYKAIQPFCSMELQRSKRLALAIQSHSFKTTFILITTNNLGKKSFKVQFFISVFFYLIYDAAFDS